MKKPVRKSSNIKQNRKNPDRDYIGLIEKVKSDISEKIKKYKKLARESDKRWADIYSGRENGLTTALNLINDALKFYD